MKPQSRGLPAWVWGFFVLLVALGGTAISRQAGWLDAPTPSPISTEEQVARVVVAKLVYVMDEKSGLCFGWHQGAVNFLVNVPCNSKPFEGVQK